MILPFGFILGADLLCVDLQCAETLKLLAIVNFTRFYATHVSILSSDLLLKFTFKFQRFTECFATILF